MSVDLASCQCPLQLGILAGDDSAGDIQEFLFLYV